MRIYKVYILYKSHDTHGGNIGDKYFFNIKNAYKLAETMLSVDIVCKIDEIETEDEIDG